MTEVKPRAPAYLGGDLDVHVLTLLKRHGERRGIQLIWLSEWWTSVTFDSDVYLSLLRMKDEGYLTSRVMDDAGLHGYTPTEEGLERLEQLLELDDGR